MQALSGIGNFFKGNLGSLIPGGLAAAGTIGNLLNLRRYNAEQDMAQSAYKNPAAYAQKVQALERPLAAGLTQGVENQVQAALGERGLSQSGPISQAALAQALAPLYMQQQSLAASQMGNILGEATKFPMAPMSDVSGPLAQLMKRFDPTAGAAGPTSDPYSTFDPGNPGQPYYPGVTPWGLCPPLAPSAEAPSPWNIPAYSPDIWSQAGGGFQSTSPSVWDTAGGFQ